MRTGDRVRLLPSGSTARVRSLQVHGEERPLAGAGARCALSLAGLSLEESGRGETVVSDPEWKGIQRFGARLRLLPDATVGLEHADTIRLYHGTAETTARVLLGSEGVLSPGSSAWAVLVCTDPIVARVKDRFVLRTVSPLRTIGGGLVTDLGPQRRWRQHTGWWEAILEGGRQETTNAVVQLAGGKGIDPAALPLRTGNPSPEAGQIVGAELIGGRLFAHSARTDARAGIIEYLRRAHADRPRSPGVSLESVRTAVSTSFAPELLEHELAGLEAEGDLERTGPEVRLREHQVDLTTREADALEQVAEILAAAELAPPPPARLAELTGADRPLLNDVLRILVDSGRLVAVNPDVYLTAEAEFRLKSGARSVLERASPAAPAAFGDELGLSRRLLIPLLEYLDRLSITRRTPQGRIPGDSQST